MEHESQNPTGDTARTPAVPPAADPAPSTESVAVSPPAYSAEPMAVRPAAVNGRSRGMRLLNIALVGAVALAIAGIAFAAGRLTAPASVTAGSFPGGGQFFGNANGQGGQGSQNGRPDGQGFLAASGLTIEGTVESITDTTLTLRTASGQTIQIALSDTTTYHAQTDASADDVTAGGKVLVRLNGRGNASGTPSASADVTGPSASDITVVP